MKLTDWLSGTDLSPPEKRMTHAEFGVLIDSGVSTVYAYCDGRIWPGREKMAAIKRVTGGAVTADDFLQKEAAE